jgi:hypothetical protein
MPIFISYSHQDSEFVDRLAAQLVQNKVSVWVDRWELNVGDSLLARIQGAIRGASALLVILSPASGNSAWVQKEVNAGLIRELEEKQVVVLPVLIDDCDIPLFLREKLYADLRSDFDTGLRRILESVARISNPNTARMDAPSYHSDWAFDWGTVADRAFFRITLVEQAQDQPFSVLGVVDIHADDVATRSYVEETGVVGLEETHRRITASVVQEINTPDDLSLLLENQHEVHRSYLIEDKSGAYDVRVSARRLGSDTGRDVIYRAGEQLQQVLQYMNDVTARSADR